MAGRKPVVALENPSLEEALQLVGEALAERRVLLLVGNCWVAYRGRASSTLEPGERLVMVKGDGSVLVHRPSGYEPVNWQPPGCLFQSRVLNDVLEIRAVRRRPRESVRLSFDQVYLASALNHVDAGEF